MPSVIPATRKHREVLRNLFDLYAHDFSEMTLADVEDNGRFTPDDFLADSWDSSEHVFKPFLLKVNTHWAGFAFVEAGSYIAPDRDRHWLMEEFFVLRKYRRLGHGTAFAMALLKRFPGIWEIGQIPKNTRATAFWRRVLNVAVNGEYKEIQVNNELWEGPVQIFEIDPR